MESHRIGQGQEPGAQSLALIIVNPLIGASVAPDDPLRSPSACSPRRVTEPAVIADRG